MTTMHPVTACCASLYGHPLAGFLLGSSWHPGGLALTDELAAMAGIGPSSVVLDAGSGRGISSVHLAESIGCDVTGLTIEEGGVKAGKELAMKRRVSDKVRFVQGDIMELSASFGAYDAVLMECVLSTLPNKGAALQRLRGLLRDRGTIAISDVTLEGDVPQELQGTVAAALCLAGALPLNGYTTALESSGSAVATARHLPEAVQEFLAQAKRGLMIAEVAIGLGKLHMEHSTFDAAKRALGAAQRLADDGSLSYAMLIASKP